MSADLLSNVSKMAVICQQICCHMSAEWRSNVSILVVKCQPVCWNVAISLLLHVRIGAKNRLSEALGLIAERCHVAAHLIIADDDTHAAAFVSDRLAEDSHAGMILTADVVEVIVERLVALNR